VVVHLQAPTAQRLGEVAHGRQEDGDAWLCAPDLGGLFHGLGHPHPVLRGIEAVEGGGLPVELVAQHHDQVAHAGGASVRRVEKRHGRDSAMAA